MSKITPDAVAALVALKPGTPAKSRLAPVGEALRRDLAWAMAVDTLAALHRVFDRVLVVGSVRAGELTRLGIAVDVVAEPDQPGMNSALTHGAALLRDEGASSVLACVGDLPSLTPASIRAVLVASKPWARAFLADESGVGTTMLIAHETLLQPRFEGRSAAAHLASGAHPIPEEVPVPDARTDVDTESDLDAAVRLGVGPATAEVLARAGRRSPTGP